VVREWIEKNLGPLGRIQGAVAGAGELGRVLSGLPAIAARSVAALNHFEAITRNGLVLAPETVAAIGRAEAKRNRWQAGALWAIALILLSIWWSS
jgi:ubiquinone biosynthesis protein